MEGKYIKFNRSGTYKKDGLSGALHVENFEKKLDFFFRVLHGLLQHKLSNVPHTNDSVVGRVNTCLFVADMPICSFGHGL